MKIFNVVKTAAQSSAIAILIAAFNGSPSQALSLTADLMNFTGDTAAGTIKIEDIDGGGVKFSANITKPTIGGDIARVAFLLDPSLLGSLKIQDFMSNLGDSNSVAYDLLTGDDACGNVFNGGGSPCKEDLKLNVALDFGRGSPDGSLLQSLSFTIADVTTADFTEAFALRYQSTGGPEGSSKLGYYYPGYMGTTSQVFYLDENQPPPPGAVPVKKTAKVQEPDEFRFNKQWKKKK